jgi:transcriptional regulator with XRE-family HTH domain
MSSGNKKFSVRLQTLINKSGFRPAEISRKTGVPPESLSRYLNEARLPKGKNLLSLANFFNADPNWLLTGKGERFIGGAGQPSPIGKDPNIVQNSEQKIEELKNKLIDALTEVSSLKDEVYKLKFENIELKKDKP